MPEAQLRRATGLVRLGGIVALLALLLSGWAGLAQDRGATALDNTDTLAKGLAAAGAHALVIGVSEFDSPVWPHLPGVDDEVARVSKAFAEQGFSVTIARDDGRMTKADLRREVRGFVDRHGGNPDNRLILYFATHGYREGGPEGYGLMIATDTLSVNDPGFAASAYSVAELSADLAQMRARHLFLFVNACFSGAMVPALGPVSRGGDVPAPDENTEAWALRLLSARARLVLTAGSDDQEVPDQGNPFVEAVVTGLAGKADLNGDGLILGSEIAQHVRGHVALSTIAAGRPNDPVFAILPDPDSTLPEGLAGDFVFLSPEGPDQLVGRDAEDLLAARQSRLPPGQFTECADCPVMVALPGPKGEPARIAMARSETTLAEWDACYREFACRRYLSDLGLGRGDRPAGDVSWQDALEFADWANGRRGDRCTRYRLPTLAEWQAAAEGARPDQAVCRDCGKVGGISSPAAMRVASLPATPLGLHDLQGNLWEWVVGEESACGFDVLRDAGLCPQDGTIVGGAFSTRADALDTAMNGATFPRSANRRTGASPLSLPTIGLRLVCDLASDG